LAEDADAAEARRVSQRQRAAAEARAAAAAAELAAEALAASDAVAKADAARAAAVTEAWAHRAAELRLQAAVACAAQEAAHRRAEADAQQLRHTWRGLNALGALLVAHRARRALRQWPGRAAWARAGQHRAACGLRAALARWRQLPAAARARTQTRARAEALALRLEAKRATAAAVAAAAARQAALPVWQAPRHRSTRMAAAATKAAEPWGLSHFSGSAPRHYHGRRAPPPASIRPFLRVEAFDAAALARTALRAWRRGACQQLACRRLGAVALTAGCRHAARRLAIAWRAWSAAAFTAERLRVVPLRAQKGATAAARASYSAAAALLQAQGALGAARVNGDRFLAAAAEAPLRAPSVFDEYQRFLSAAAAVPTPRPMPPPPRSQRAPSFFAGTLLSPISKR